MYHSFIYQFASPKYTHRVLTFVGFFGTSAEAHKVTRCLLATITEQPMHTFKCFTNVVHNNVASMRSTNGTNTDKDIRHSIGALISNRPIAELPKECRDIINRCSRNTT